MFKEKDLVLLIDSKGKKYLFSLKKDKIFSFHKGKVSHNEILKKEEGDFVISSKGEKLFIFKPTLFEYLLKIKRKTQIIYPKDIAQIIAFGDIFPGAKVFEAGTGSGALTLALLRAVGKKGLVVSYEKRKDILETAQKNIKNFIEKEKKFQEFGKLILKNKDLKEGIEEKDFDRAILDLPEPWLFLEEIKKVLKDGGIFLAWLPTVLQVFKLVEEAKKTGDFYLVGIYEFLERKWQKIGKSLRPCDRMVAHTGFLLVFRKIKKL